MSGITMRLVFFAAIISVCSYSAVAQNSDHFDTAFPQQGEGIYKLLRRNGIPPTSANVADFRDLNENKFLPDDGLRKDVEYTLPATESTVFEPLFGPKYERVTIKSNELKGCVYYIVSGHGGIDSGAVGVRNGQKLHEDEYAYDISLRLARSLMEQSATVYNLIQDKDGIRDTKYLGQDHDEVNLGGSRVSRDQIRRLRERTSKINSLYDKNRSSARLQRVVEIHVDARDKSSTQIDVHFIYSSRQGKNLSNILLDTFKAQYQKAQPGRGYNGKITQRNLMTLRETKPVATYIELGNIHHKGDQVRIIDPDNRQALAEWLTLGLIREASLSTK